MMMIEVELMMIIGWKRKLQKGNCGGENEAVGDSGDKEDDIHDYDDDDDDE